jgi:hypothetical protein
MKEWLKSGFGCFLLVVGACVPAFAIAEVGVGMMTATGPASEFERFVIVAHALLDIACFGLGADLWIGETSEEFVLFPYVQLQIPLMIAKIYAAAGPKFWVDAQGLTMVPPSTTVLAKVGLALSPLPVLGLYGEMVFGISPLAMMASAPAYLIGMRLGF